MIIGLTGKNASGKGEVANYLKNKGYSYFSLSDSIREEAKKSNLEPTRENLIKLGNDLRKKFGPDYLAKKISEKVTDNSVVDSIRSSAEVEELRKLDNFILIGIDSPIKIRFQRSKERGRIGDGVDIEEFRKLEEKENYKNSQGQQLNKCLDMADEVIFNDSTLEDLYEKVDEVINKCDKK